jgi:hypothetical protein
MWPPSVPISKAKVDLSLPVPVLNEGFLNAGATKQVSGCESRLSVVFEGKRGEREKGRRGEGEKGREDLTIFDGHRNLTYSPA